MESLTVGDLSFEVRRSARRGSVQITVDRGGELILSAPEACPTAKMTSFVREKRFWIYTKLAEKEVLRAEASARQFVSGEGFSYLGRSYRLLLVDDQAVPVKLERGRFSMTRAAAAAGREHMIRWYADRGRTWLAERASRYVRRVGVAPADVSVRDLGFRWGSCGKGNKLYFHWRTMMLPPSIAEYVVVHELVHLAVPHHTPEFWRRLERALPDFAARKQLLTERGASVTLTL
jgi:predicted metal-dependent hydrolase